MVGIEDYQGREQTYVKHVFLASYLERLVHKTASAYGHIVYVDGFAGPWQSANEQYQDTSFGIALSALRNAKTSWKRAGRDVRMSAHLVERDPQAHARLAGIPPKYPDIHITAYGGDFLMEVPTILKAIPNDAFAFFLVDPKGWRIPLRRLSTLLTRRNSEVIFNFMFDFINRAASIKDPLVAAGLDELIPYGDWRRRLEEAERAGLGSEERKAILVDAFSQSLARLGNFKYVAETTVLRPLKDRPLYCLVYASRHSKGIEVFRDCQAKALEEQSKTRAAVKVKHAETATGQREIFESLHDMAPNEISAFLTVELREAEKTLLGLTPYQPAFTTYEEVWPQVLAKHVIRKPDVNQIAARLRVEGRLIFPDWEKTKRVPQPGYKMQRPSKSA